ncbi:MAG: YceD family protein [Succinivibrionaceae bacterium]
MQNIKLPVEIDPVRAAAKKLDYQGIVEKKDLKRLGEMVTSVCSDVQAQVSFYKDLSGINVISGSAETSVILPCQRCGDDFELALKTQFRYSPDGKLLEQLDLADDFDCVDLNSFGEINLYDIIEDELILSLPLIARHPIEDCPAAEMIESMSGDGQGDDGTYSPFAILGDLMKDGNKK